jgi:hypothetical protein
MVLNTISSKPGHPRLHEHGDPLVIPAGGITPGIGEVAVEYGNGILIGRRDLAPEERPVTPVAPRRLVGGDDVRELVADDPVHPLVRRTRIVGIFEGLDTERYVVEGNRRGARIAVVVKILKMDRDRPARFIPEHAPVKGHRVLVAPREMSHDVFVPLIVIGETQVLRLDRAIVNVQFTG